jgi:hypothetical protein
MCCHFLCDLREVSSGYVWQRVTQWVSNRTPGSLGCPCFCDCWLQWSLRQEKLPASPFRP